MCGRAYVYKSKHPTLWAGCLGLRSVRVLGSCNCNVLFLGLGGFFLGRFLLLGVSALEDCAGLGDDAGEHRCLFHKCESGLVHNHTQVIALGGENWLFGGRLDTRSAQAQALIKHDGFVEIALGIGLVDDVALQVLGEVALRTDTAVRFCAVEHHDLELGGKTLTLTEVSEHHSEYRHHDVLGLGALHAVNCEEFGDGLKLSLNAHLTLVQEYGCICRYVVDAEDAVGDVETGVGISIFLCHNQFRLEALCAPFVRPHTPPSVCEEFVKILLLCSDLTKAYYGLMFTDLQPSAMYAGALKHQTFVVRLEKVLGKFRTCLLAVSVLLARLGLCNASDAGVSRACGTTPYVKERDYSVLLNSCVCSVRHIHLLVNRTLCERCRMKTFHKFRVGTFASELNRNLAQR